MYDTYVRAYNIPAFLISFRREMLVGADRCLGDIVSEMLSTIEDSDQPHEEAHIYLCTLFPQFSHIFSDIKEVRFLLTGFCFVLF